MILIYVTHKNKREAKKVADHLLTKKLIACANTMPITSSYFWEGKKVNDAEIVTILKTRDSLWTKVRDEVKKVHPYKVPCIMKMNVEANAEYEEWIRKETK
jgi:periplasmic divalent cation tolerance protein